MKKNIIIMSVHLNQNNTDEIALVLDEDGDCIDEAA